MCVCKSMCVYVYQCVCSYIINVCVYQCVYVYKCVCMYVYVHIYTYMCVHKRVGVKYKEYVTVRVKKDYRNLQFTRTPGWQKSVTYELHLRRAGKKS